MFKIIFTFISLFSFSYCESSTPWIGEAREGSWLRRHEVLVNQTIAHKSDAEIIFIGDSITERWTTMGKALWDKYYASRHAFNYGIGGDRTENVIYRIEHKEFDGLKPKVVVLKIGTNNMGTNSTSSAQDIAKAIHVIIDLLEEKMPTAHILLLGVLPRGSHVIVSETNELISKFGDNKHVFYLDMTDHFVTAPGKIIVDLFLPHSVHLTEKGYQVWHTVMEPLLKKLLDMKDNE